MPAARSLPHRPDRARRPQRRAPAPEWQRDLPTGWRRLVVAPLSLETHSEYELAAHRTVGRDEDEQPCYCAWSIVVTEARSDDDEDYYRVTAYAESLSAWRLRDGRWLIRRVVTRDGDGGRPFFSLGDEMPR